MAVWAVFVLSTLVVYISIAEGAENFNAHTHLCCNGTVSKMMDNAGCCGKQVFDTTEFACCDNQVFPLPPGLDGPMGHGCCYASSGSAKPYDTRTHECCNGAIMEKPDKDIMYGCCADQLFDYKEQLCCADKLVPRQDGDECCGDKVYNISRQVCCEQWGLQGEKWAQEFTDIFDRKGEHTFCCGRAVFDSSSEVCCNDKVLAKPSHIDSYSAGCCGAAVFDHQTQLCCQPFNKTSGAIIISEGMVREKTGPGISCCGVDVFNFHEQVCCEDKVLPKPKGMDKEMWGTCCGAEVITNLDLQLCDDNDKLVARNSSNLWACGNEGKLFDITKQTCCFDEILEDSDDMACCHLARKPYNRKKENCCGDKVLPLTDEDISGGKLACCAPFPYYGTFITE